MMQYPTARTLGQARLADLHAQAHRAALARAATRVAPGAPQPGRHRIPVSLRRALRQCRFGDQLWTLLHAQVLLDGPAASGCTSLTENSCRRVAAWWTSR